MGFKKYFFTLIIFIFLLNFASLLCQVNLASAQPAQGEDKSVPLINPLGGTTDKPTGNVSISSLIGKVINAVLGIVGSLALAMFIYGGFTWMIAAGSPERVQRGKDIILWATVGLIVIFSSYAIVKLVLDTIGQK